MMQVNPADLRVTVIGLGAMGSRIARRLAEAGYRVSGWNRTPERTLELSPAGVAPASAPAAAARGADVVLTMVSDPEALAAVTEGPEGVAAGLDARATVIEMSTVGPAAVSRLAEALPAGVRLLDAPVLGSIGEADEGSLQLFVGGAAEVVEQWSGLLRHLGNPIHVGPLGTGAAAKLVANAALLGTVGLVGETVALADRLGLPRDVAFRVLGTTPLAAQAERRRPAIESREHPPRYALSLAGKDARLIVGAASGAGPELRLLRAVAEWLDDAQSAGLGASDYTALLTRIIGEALPTGLLDASAS
jgi:3-hydroxyisobutyrate dehydrogenase/2-hydroxy-3-oxopropionate reductase